MKKNINRWVIQKANIFGEKTGYKGYKIGKSIDITSFRGILKKVTNGLQKVTEVTKQVTRI